MTVRLSVPGEGTSTALLLRPWRRDDIKNLVAAHQDELLRRTLTTPLTDEPQAQEWLKAQAAGWVEATRFSFAVVSNADDQFLLGYVVVKVETAGVAQVGYWTAAHARGTGVAPRALATASRWALETQKMVSLSRLELFHAIDNSASCRVANKCGYALREVLTPAPPAFPSMGHRHVRVPSRQSP
ncbi:GNAT family N-acetyltransferase [Actinoplanes sp. TRM 88003]|uniref:GNAT family N-acetyltransferase n=1 Tax=Paractinoplanes aksuensis TaxID=2939490 RepID=A0ABT1DVC7_9ACTN|nr:GNAT family N-acetyltransferase [Actinoplanes aksuensis]MCO8274011.1 GNAT family N-acetyltransferase [Actinoplanes aksuensis]